MKTTDYETTRLYRIALWATVGAGILVAGWFIAFLVTWSAS